MFSCAILLIRCAEQPYSELELDAGGAKNNHKRKKKTRNDDVRCVFVCGVRLIDLPKVQKVGYY